MKELEFLSDASAFLVGQLPSWLAAGYLLVKYFKGGNRMFRKLMRILNRCANSDVHLMDRMSTDGLRAIATDARAIHNIAIAIIRLRKQMEESTIEGGEEDV